jgi:membrane-associated phospholipid phosphatase
MLAFQSYILLLIVRTIAMYSIPLDPPHAVIPLIDPFVKYLGTGIQLNKDLFFSGHTATLFLLYLVSENKILKTVFLICTITVGLSVLIQHNHYTVDVISAPFFAYGIYKIVLALRNRYIDLI